MSKKKLEQSTQAIDSSNNTLQFTPKILALREEINTTIQTLNQTEQLFKILQKLSPNQKEALNDYLTSHLLWMVFKNLNLEQDQKDFLIGLIPGLGDIFQITFFTYLIYSSEVKYKQLNLKQLSPIFLLAVLEIIAGTAPAIGDVADGIMTSNKWASQYSFWLKNKHHQICLKEGIPDSLIKHIEESPIKFFELYQKLIPQQK